jgi:hypothetical protein
MNSSVLDSVSEDELTSIASLDYGQSVHEHMKALRTLIFEQRGELREGQQWYPYEVVELGSHVLTPGHEREFAICTLLVLAAVACGVDNSTDVYTKFQDRADDYDRLPATLRQEVLDAYQTVDR